jgi:glyoxylase I family protein
MKPSFIDHIVLIVKDLKETEKFYTSLLGTPVHLFEDYITYQIGETQIFFAGADPEWKSIDKDSGGLNHLAFGVRTIEELKKFENKLNEVGIKNSGIKIDKYGKRDFIWFDDPNNYRLEFYCRPN